MLHNTALVTPVTAAPSKAAPAPTTASPDPQTRPTASPGTALPAAPAYKEKAQRAPFCQAERGSGGCERNQRRLCTSYLGCQNAAFMSGALYYQKRGYFRLLSSPSGAAGDRCCRSSFRSQEIESHSKAARDFWERGVSLHPHQPLCMLPAAEQNWLPAIRQVPLNYYYLKHFLPNLLSYFFFSPSLHQKREGMQ